MTKSVNPILPQRDSILLHSIAFGQGIYAKEANWHVSRVVSTSSAMHWPDWPRSVHNLEAILHAP